MTEKTQNENVVTRKLKLFNTKKFTTIGAVAVGAAVLLVVVNDKVKKTAAASQNDETAQVSED